MKYHYAVCVIIAIFCSANTNAQGNWENYITEFDNGKAGSILVDLSQYDKAPDKRYPYEVITGPVCNKCMPDGLPEKEEIGKLEDILGVATNTITSISENVLVGTLSYNDQRVNYYYVKDTIGMRHDLNKMYNKFFKGYNYTIQIKADPEWKDYRDFLYPSEQAFTWIENSKIIDRLMQAGDSLKTPREVDFYLSFNNADDRRDFATFAKAKDYNILGANLNEGKAHPYEIEISKITPVTPDSIWPLTNEIKEQAKKNNAYYNGWETIPVTATR